MIFFGILLLIFENFKGKKLCTNLIGKIQSSLGFQVLALIPGASRSAVVIWALYLGYQIKDALRVSFLLLSLL